jgi:GNAT superfamily N-acetyltransferase
MIGAVEVRPIAAADTHSLRHAVLRDSSPNAMLDFEGDDEPTTLHLGAFQGEALVGIATFLHRPCSDTPDATHAVQLRGMAVLPTLQSGGVGTVLLQAAIERLRGNGVDVLWANARDSALGFYQGRLGMTVGDHGFVTAVAGVPHHRVWIWL